MKKRRNPHDVYGRLERQKKDTTPIQPIENDPDNKSLEEQEEQFRRERLDFERQKLEADKTRAKSQALGDVGKGLSSVGSALTGCGCALPLVIVGVLILLAALGLLK